MDGVGASPCHEPVNRSEIVTGGLARVLRYATAAQNYRFGIGGGAGQSGCDQGVQPWHVPPVPEGVHLCCVA
jgi:hypothetical protein